jgi:uncharacterized protein DUF3883
VFRDAAVLIEECRDTRVQISQLGPLNRIYQVARLDLVLEMSKVCGWVRVRDNWLEVTSQGVEILAIPEGPERLRHQLRDFLDKERPVWLSLTTRGVAVLSQSLSEDEHQCFLEADLLDPDIPGVVEWWDSLARLERDATAADLLAIGREGEMGSIRYEERRTGKRPRWIAFESNYAGYDLLSIVSAVQRDELRIEVKASTLPLDVACIELSSNEWRTAKSEGNHIFHVWLLRDGRLMTLSPAEIGAHVPQDQGEGTWTVVRIPFASFDATKWRNERP